MVDLFEKLKFGAPEEVENSLDKFITEFGEVTTFDFLDTNLRSEIWDLLSKYLTREGSAAYEKCLVVLRILSRDKNDLDAAITNDVLNTILKYAELDERRIVYSTTRTCIEAQKLLCNLLFNSWKMQKIMTDTKCLHIVMDHIKKYSDNTPLEIKLFGVKLVFLATALIPSTRSLLCQLGGIDLFISLLERTSKECVNYVMQDDNVILACEILKALFNLFIYSTETLSEDVKANEKLIEIASFLLKVQNTKQEENLQSNVVNLITVLPSSCFPTIIICVDSHGKFERPVLYHNRDMTDINTLLKFLNTKLDAHSDFAENLSPILTALIRLCKSVRLIRKYTKLQILPPLRDVLRRPEEGSEMRNKLCKLLTSPITQVRDLVAEFLFILCKEKVARMIKYTGYGNAAGMFANKGLLGNKQMDSNYSSQSEDSETEEYEKYKEGINPVIGCYEWPKPNPLEGMSEEKKEYVTMELVNLMDKLQKGGIFQPCKIGEDGKPQTIHHVLELQEQISEQQLQQHSDSD